jgi:hypothetical protein
MLLFCQLVVGVAVRIDRAIQLLERHESRNEFIIRVQQAAQVLLGLDMVDLDRVSKALAVK